MKTAGDLFHFLTVFSTVSLGRIVRRCTTVGVTQACLCIRNIAARGPDLRQTMLDEGCEAALRDAGKISGCVDEAYMALRDLRCEVTAIVALDISRLRLITIASLSLSPFVTPYILSVT